MAPREKLAKMRAEAGLTQREIALELGMTDQAVSNWEQGISIPKLTPMQTLLLCEILECSLKELVDAFKET
jgi:transcriptional regulator with XRE-family HTH domain